MEYSLQNNTTDSKNDRQQEEEVLDSSNSGIIYRDLKYTIQETWYNQFKPASKLIEDLFW